MTAQTSTYDPLAVVLTLNALQIEGYAPDTGVEVTFDEPQITDTTGIGGDTEVNVSHNYNASVKVTLMASSPSNDYLSGLVQAGALTGPVLGVGLLKDGNGGTLVASSNAVVQGYPEGVKYGKNAGARVWTIRFLPATKGATFIAGSGPGGIIGAALGALGL